jgi:hypothetical protein
LSQIVEVAVMELVERPSHQFVMPDVLALVGVHRSSTAQHMQADVDGERGGKVRLAIRLECRRTREEVEAELAYEAILVEMGYSRVEF